MENNNQKLPELPVPIKVPEFLEADKWFDADISGDMLDFAEPYRPPRYTLERNGVRFADVGDMHIVTGKPGSGKTGLISQIMAAILSGRFGNTQYCLEDKPKPALLYIDTEQGKDDTIAIKNRVCTLAGLPYDKPLEQFRIMRLRDTEEAIDRWRKILKAIYVYKPTDIFLDGMLDIVKDYNDQVECQPVVRKCMKVATEYDASLWAVLHENPMVDKLVGSLGSIAQRKVSEIFAVRKIKQQDQKPNERKADFPEIYFQVKQLKARGRDVRDWYFGYIANSGGWGVPSELDNPDVSPTPPPAPKPTKEKPPKTLHTTDELQDWIIKRQNDLQWPTTRSDFARFVLAASGVGDPEEQKELTRMAIARRFILEQSKEEMAEGQKNPRLKLNEETIMPF